MAFNFNWSPLIADTSRARDMLTSALNKSPKPPIIVDDIIVTELNLGSTPPELEILEIGDLAEDRFRGIFKMSYTGDAFLTLKTRVQANPLNTYLSTKPSFASPQPLAAASGLTIPLQITLSDIRLSGFVILVFSRQKGLTIVFRNDPLESLKVSSTFDSIPFVRDYLQKEIEGQLRLLFMEDLPAILHRLSLQMFVPDYAEPEVNKETSERLQGPDEAVAPIDPLASPPQNPVDWTGDEEMRPFSLESSETHATFSQKNLLRLAALTESHRTLSLFTPSIRDTVFRAWAGAATGEYGEHTTGVQTPSYAALSLSRVNSSIGTLSSAASVSSKAASDSEVTSSRPSLVSYASTGSMGAPRSRTTNTRKRKKRVINLRRDKDGSESASSEGSRTTTSTPAPSVRGSSAPSVIAEEPEREQEEDLATPPRSPKVRFQSGGDSIDQDIDVTPRLRPTSNNETPPTYESSRTDFAPDVKSSKQPSLQPAPPLRSTKSSTYMPPHSHSPFPSNYPSTSPLFRSFSNSSLASTSAGSTSDTYSFGESSGGILEQAWMQKMAAEIARKVRDEKAALAFRERNVRAEPPPPAYGV
ncbi:hypothetical protein NA57DRAFT_62849 [Rhizodiscina lignyota]|uniref:Mitochondrial distribution and morphology protein 34 n=1 Tax=Rhizodiscina lignyota TaxID=1504668 RepID=A0A9P4MBB5_9PEZI|nr:hypothetical protein NA57DRAFT_62849 [Rhizodiscina lignyota]